MLRKSLQILLAALLLGLLFTVGFAALRLGGPQENLAEAEAAIARGEYARAVVVLEHGERSPSLRADRSKLQKLLRLRYSSFLVLGNASAALADLEALLATEPADAAALRADHVRLLALNGQSQRALTLADAWRASDPSDGRAHELAGEAAQTLYQEELRKVSAALARDAGRRDATRAQATLLQFLYRPDGDPRVPVAIDELAALYRNSSQLIALWPELQQRLIVLRGSIQAGLERFRSSMEATGEPVAAFRGLSLSFQQAERTDDLLLLCEAYRRRFDHVYVLEAGTQVLWGLLAQDQLVAALAAAERWLPEAEVQAAITKQRFPSDLDGFLVARTLVAHRLGDATLIRRFGRQVFELGKAGAPLQLGQAFSSAVTQRANGQFEGAERAMAWAMQLAGRQAVPVGQQDLLPVLAPLRLEAMQRRSAPFDEINGMYTAWANARPGELAPLLAQADFQIGAGRGAAAAATCNRAVDLAPFDEDLLARRLAAHRLQFEGTDQDGPGLLRQCVQRGTLVPEANDPLGFLLCAEAAIALGQPQVLPIAVAAARAAGDRLPWSRRPRLLEAAAERQLGRHDNAARVLDTLVARGDDDPETLRMLLAARQVVGAPFGDVAAQALAAGEPEPATLAAVLRSVPEAQRAAALPFAQRALALRTQFPTLTPRCATVFAAAGDLATADQLLGECRTPPEPLPNDWLQDVATAVLARLAADPSPDDAALAARAERDLADFGLRTAAAAEPLLAAAPRLAIARPRTALAVLGTALAFARPEQRNGALFTLAGDLALRGGSVRLAEQHWTAALAFADGRAAAEPLARLCLVDDRVERAAQVYGLVEQPSDLGLALRFGSRAQRGPAETIARARLLADRTDLRGHLAAELLGLPSPSDLAVGPQPLVDSVCKILALAASPELTPAAIPEAAALVAARPKSRAAKLLHAHLLAQVGRFAEAAQIHAGLFDPERFADPAVDLLLLGEAARAAADPRYTMPAPLADRLRIAVARNRLTDCPPATAFALRLATRMVEATGQQELAARVRTEMWVQMPGPTGATLADAERLLAEDQALAAWWIVERLLPELPLASADAAIDLQIRAARRALATTENNAVLFYDRALAAIASHGSHGAAVHFVLDRASSHRERAPTRERRVALLVDQLQRTASTAGEAAWAMASANRLLELAGYEATIAALQRAIAGNPTSLPLWLTQTRLAAQRTTDGKALRALRNVLAGCDAGEARVEYTILAGRYFTLDPSDVAAFQALPEALRTTPRGRLAAGLVALRSGQPAVALQHLPHAAADGDGMHLLALAEAHLQANQQDGVARAAAALRTLATDYPSSSLAQNAGSFARQWAPRAASAPASPPNR